MLIRQVDKTVKVMHGCPCMSCNNMIHTAHANPYISLLKVGAWLKPIQTCPHFEVQTFCREMAMWCLGLSHT